jgi:hypothetical protein
MGAKKAKKGDGAVRPEDVKGGESRRRVEGGREGGREGTRTLITPSPNLTLRHRPLL